MLHDLSGGVLDFGRCGGTCFEVADPQSDLSLREEWVDPIEANMVFTVEPGIYIPEENLGIRIEDDVVVQENGDPFNLMRNIPIEADEIEDLMNS